MSYDNIPSELREIDQWVTWKQEGERKRPYIANTQYPASPTDPTTWRSFAEVQDSDKIGFGLMEDDPYVVVDFDHCVDKGVIHPNVVKTMKLLGSYAEFSPSGTGVHVWVKGTIARNRTEHKDGRAIEQFCSKRFVTVTGNHVEGTPLTIEHRQDELDRLNAALDTQFPPPPQVKKVTATKPYALRRTDEQVMRMATNNATTGKKFSDIYFKGDLSYNKNNHSRADLGLIHSLLYWTNDDEEQTDRLFRKSKLYRDKWDEKHGDMTYGELTIQKAVIQREDQRK